MVFFLCLLCSIFIIAVVACLLCQLLHSCSNVVLFVTKSREIFQNNCRDGQTKGARKGRGGANAKWLRLAMKIASRQ